jgi:hypothetical protein
MCDIKDSLTILFLVDNLRMLPICPDLHKLHDRHVVPMFKMAMDAGYREEMGWTNYTNYRSAAYVALRNAALQYFHKKLNLATETDGEIVLIDQAEKYMMACDYLWVHSCRDQKEQAARVLETLRPVADNLHDVVEKLQLCRMVIEGVEPNQTQIIQTIRRLLPREVEQLLIPQAHLWNETIDQPDLDKFLRVVQYVLVAEAPAITNTNRKVLGVQQATKEEQAETSMIRPLTQVTTLQRSQPSKLPDWVFEQNSRRVNRQTSRQYSNVVFAKASVIHSNQQHTEAPVDWLVDLGSQVTGIRADLPMAKSIRWSRPSVELRTLSVEGEAWVTLEFVPVPGKLAVKRKTRLFKIRGLSVEAVLGTDVLLKRRRCEVELDEGTQHGVMEIGLGEVIPVGMSRSSPRH